MAVVVDESADLLPTVRVALCMELPAMTCASAPSWQPASAEQPKKYPAARGHLAFLAHGYCRLRFLWFGHDPYGDEPSRKILLLL